MKTAIKHLWPLVALICASSAILLLSDHRPERTSVPEPAGQESVPGHPATAGKKARVAICYPAETEANTVFLNGLMDGFTQAGYREGVNLEIIKGHGSGDISMLPQATQSLVARKPDLLIAASSSNLSAAIRVVDSSLPIVFGYSAAPLEAGGGTSFTDHRPNVTGAVFTIPTLDLVQQVRRTFPQAQTVGILYNPAEVNAVKEMAALKKLFFPLGIRFIIGTVNTAAEVPQALLAVLQQRPDLLYLMCENTVYNCMQPIIAKATEAGIPIVVDEDSMMGSGALLSQGPSPYFEGRRTGRIASRILQGESPADMPFAPSTEHPLTVDLQAVAKLSIALTAELTSRISKVYHFAQYYGRPAKIMLALYNEAPFAGESERGIHDGLKQAGLVEGTDFTLRTLNAQGDMSTLTAMMGTIDAERPDLLFAVSTPCLQGALRLVSPEIPIVFTAVANGVLAGAGKSETDHAANVTGITTCSPFAEMADMIKASVPDIRKAGTLFSPAEVNSVFYVGSLTKALAERGIELVTVPVTSTAEVAQAAEALCNSRIQVIAQVSDNCCAAAIGQIVQRGAQKGIPTFVFDSSQVGAGATVCVGRDFYDCAIEASRKAVRVLLGESPGSIPFSNARSKTVIVDEEKAARFGLVRPGKAADPAPGRRWKIAVLEYVNVHDTEDAERGIRDGFRNAGLVEGRDYELTVQSAQGDQPTLPTMVDAAVSARADLLMTLSTATLQAAIQRANGTPIVFTYCANGVAAGAGTSNDDHLPNVTGASTGGAYEDLARTVRECLPNAKRVGTIYVPSEPNMLFHRDSFAREAEKVGLELVTVAANTSPDVPMAAEALCTRDIDAVCQLPGSVVATGFPGIVRAAYNAHLPLFGFMTSQAEQGAAVAVARDYYQGGIDAANIAVKVMRGASPATLPFQPVTKSTVIVNPAAAKECGLAIPESVMKRAGRVIEP